ncbi:hypothetical protein KA005_70545, partial [bacterium]|nr:hypothetical protein [bacterium]
NTFAKYISFVVEEGDYLNDFLADLPEWLQPIVLTVGRVVSAFKDFFEGLATGEDIIGDISNLAYDLALAFGMNEEEASGVFFTVQNLINSFIEFKETVMEFMTPIIDWIANTVTWKDVLIALGIAILTVVIPAVISLLATLLPIILTIGALILIVALIRKAWETDWGGIRTTLLNVWNNTIKPKLELLREWLEEKIPIAIETLKSFWEDTLKPALENFWEWIETTVFPLLQDLWDWLETNIPAAIQTLTDFWNDTLYPIIEKVWKFLSEDMMPIWEALGELLEVTVGTAIEALTGIWENVLQPALKDIWEWIKDKIIPKFDAMSVSVGGVTGAIETVVGWINTLIEKIKNIKLPDWMKPGSASPWEVSLLGSASALSLLNDQMGLFDQRMDLRTPA